MFDSQNEKVLDMNRVLWTHTVDLRSRQNADEFQGKEGWVQEAQDIVDQHTRDAARAKGAAGVTVTQDDIDQAVSNWQKTWLQTKLSEKAILEADITELNRISSIPKSDPASLNTDEAYYASVALESKQKNLDNLDQYIDVIQSDLD